MSVGQVQEGAAAIPFPQVKRYRIWGDFLPETDDPVDELRKDAGGEVVVQATTAEKALHAYYRKLDRKPEQTRWKALVMLPEDGSCQVWEAEYGDGESPENVELKYLRTELVDPLEVSGKAPIREIKTQDAPAEAAPAPQATADPIPDRPPLVLPLAKVEPTDDAMREFFERVKALRLAERMAEQDVALASSRLKTAKANHLTASEALGRLLDEGPEDLPLIDRKPSQAAPAKPQETAEEASSNAVAEPALEIHAEPPAGPPDESWKMVPVHQLAIPPAVADRLAENGCATLGSLEELRGGKGLRSIRGIGQAKADAIEEAVLAWLSKNRDAAVLTAPQVGVVDDIEDDDGDTD